MIVCFWPKIASMSHPMAYTSARGRVVAISKVACFKGPYFALHSPLRAISSPTQGPDPINTRYLFFPQHLGLCVSFSTAAWAQDGIVRCYPPCHQRIRYYYCYVAFLQTCLRASGEAVLGKQQYYAIQPFQTKFVRASGEAVLGTQRYLVCNLFTISLFPSLGLWVSFSSDAWAQEGLVVTYMKPI